MEYNSKNTHVEESLDFENILQYAIRVLQKWWAVVLAAVICAGVGFGVAKATYTPTYTCTMRFVVDNKSETTVVGGQSVSDLNAAIALAKNYALIMTDTRSLMEIVAENSGYKVNNKALTGDDVKKMISCNLVEDTSIIALSVTSTNPDVSYAVAVSYANNYAQITEKAYGNTRAILIDEPVKPQKANSDRSTILYTLLGFVAGAGMVVLVICATVFIKDTVKTADDITNKIGSKILGTTLYIKLAGKKGEKQNLLITDKKTGFMFIESFKLIRTKIENISKRKNYKTFVFTSTAAHEGKTTTATNTALALAKSGKSVLLIDADLRKPSVYKELGISAANEAGLTGVIRGEKSLSDSIKYFEKFNLFLLVTSQPDAESAEVLASDEMADIIEAVKNEFDYVIIDTPPAGLVADAAILAQYADGCIMVVRNDFSSKRRIKKTIEDMESTSAEVIGCIYNCAESSTASKLIKNKRSKKGYYGYGYGYGYSSTHDSKK